MEERRTVLEALTVTELRGVCKEYQIPYSTKNKKFTKPQLVDKILMFERAGEKAEEILGTNKEETKVEYKEPVVSDNLEDVLSETEQKKEERPKQVEGLRVEDKKQGFKNYGEYKKVLDVIKEKYTGFVNDEFLKNIKNGDLVVFIHHVEAQNGRIYEKLRTAKIYAINRKRQVIKVRTILGTELQLAYNEVLYIKKNDKTSEYPTDISILMKRQRTEKGRNLINEKMAESNGV